MKAAFASILILASAVLATRPIRHRPNLSNVKGPVKRWAEGDSQQLAKRQNAGTNEDPAVGYFEQPIDHNNPSLGTFKMRYFWSNQNWKGPDSPVVLFAPGEEVATDFFAYFENYTATDYYTSPGQLAHNIGAAFIMLENRYYGESSPYPELTTANLQYMTFEQTIHDLVNFAANVKLPFSPNSTASNVPWVLTGGSYAGVMTTYVASKLPGTFWAYYASSATVEDQESFWRMNLGFQAGGPKNCTKDAALVIDYVDQVFSSGNRAEIVDLKTKFGLQNLTDDIDFLSTLATDPEMWFQMQYDFNIDGKSNADFANTYLWCDVVEGAWDPVKREYTNITLPGAEGVGLQKALENWASWWKYYNLPGSCQAAYGSHYPGIYSENSTYCYQTVDLTDPFYTDLSVGNPWNRQYSFMQCNEPNGFWPTGAPKGTPSIVSRLLSADAYAHQCKGLFPPGPKGQTYGLRTQDQYNAYYGGWNIQNTKRLLYVNGEYDYYRPATVAAPQRPGGPRPSTPDIPTWIVPGGLHNSDFLIRRNARHNSSLRKVIDEVLAQLKTWVEEWPAYHAKLPGV